jgi:hypothetical protein
VREGARWVRGHYSRGEGGYTGRPAGMEPLPGPGQIEFDAGIIDVETVPDQPDPGSDDESGPGSPPARPAPAGGLPPPPPDEPPAHARRDWHRQDRAAKASKPGRPPRITAAIRADIDAKISFALEIPGRVWAARDPACGAVFLEQRAEISRAMADIACRSPQLVEWFTGTGGGFLMFLDLGAALWPVVTMIMAHHVYHSVELEADGGGHAEPLQPDYSRFAA